ALIQSRGGVSGLAASDASHKQGRRRTNNAGNDAVADEVARHALARLKTSKGIGTLTIKQPIRIGGGNLSVLLARRDASGPVAILGSSNDSNQIEAVATTVARRDLTNVCASLRTLVEIIGTQTYPWHALPSSRERRAKWFRTQYAEKGDLYDSDLEGWEGEEPGRRLTSSKRLLLRGESREAIFSGSLVTVSPVTRCILNEPLIEVGDVVFLRTDERGQIEQWCESGELALLRADPELRGLQRASDSDGATYKLEVKSTITELTKILHFYDHSPDKNTHHQAEFRRDAFKSTWHSKLNADWFQNLRQ